ncbi:MAG: threonine synthase [Paludibacteraceae bacterium]
MRYYSTNKTVENVTLEDAVVKGLADDKGLFMPNEIKRLPNSFFDIIQTLSFQEIAYVVADAFFGEEIEPVALNKIVYETLEFDTPLVEVKKGIYSLELYHGPTLAFKDVGARFMSRVLRYFIQKQHTRKLINVLVATSGDTGSAVANGFLGIDGIRAFVLYPKGKVSKIQESQFTTLRKNIVALEIDGTFDDCQRLVKTAFLDPELSQKLQLTSANSINVARFLPQAFYYFYAFAQLRSLQPKLTAEELQTVICVPSGNLGNITAGLFAKRMGLPIKRFIAANNKNDIFLQYLNTGIYTPKPSVATIANAMDVGDPSNFARILDLYNYRHSDIKSEISGVSYTDEQIAQGVRACLSENSYLLDPHGACGYLALNEMLEADENGIFLETAHPAKFAQTVESIIEKPIEIPPKLQVFMQGEKKSIELGKEFEAFKQFLIKQ